MRPTYHYDKNHKMIYVGQKVLAEGREYTVGVTETNNGGITYVLTGNGSQRRLNEFGARQIELVIGTEKED